MTDTASPMALAVNHAMAQMESLRAQFLQGLGIGAASSDIKRPKAWCEYGFPSAVTGDDLYQMWRRNGVAHGAVEKLVSNCWKTAPELVYGGKENSAKQENKTESEWADFAKRTGLWKAFKRADEMRLVRRWSAIIIYFADSKGWSEPVAAGAKRVEKLRPVWASALRATLNDMGDVTHWTYIETNPDGVQLREVQIHPDRIFIVGDTAADALGLLEPAYNDLVSLEKLCGGGGESFLKNAARQLAVTFDKEVDMGDIAAMYGVPLDGLKTEFQKAAQNMNRGNDSLLAMQGAQVSTLVSTVPDPGPIYNCNLQNVAAALDIPTKILVGMQTGERASTEDREYFNSRCQSRRSDLGEEVQDFMRRMIDKGVLPAAAEITIQWDDLNESSQGDKLDNAKKMADTNAAAIDPANEPYTVNEIRMVAGFEPREAGDGDE